MATVYRARDTQLRREVAVKVLHPHLSRRPELVARFQREARAAAGLEHDHILRVYDVGGGADADPPYIVLELVRGLSLREVIAEHGAMPAEVAACAGVALAEALAVAHRAGIIHRDLKPANVMVADGGRLLLGDFGVARIEDEDSVVTRTGAILGTPAFMSPEQALGGDLDGRSDLYSLGATLYQLATGQMPFSGSTPRVVAQITEGELTPPARINPTIGPDLAAVIERLMAREPDARYPDAAAALAALAEVASAGGLEDPDQELEDYFADPAAWVRERQPGLVRATVTRAQGALDRRELPRAMALLDRALAIAPNDPEALALLDRLGSGQRRARWLAVAGVAVLVGAGSVIAMTAWPGPENQLALAVADAGLTDAGAVAEIIADAAGEVAVTAPPDTDAAAVTALAAAPVDVGPLRTDPRSAPPDRGERRGTRPAVAVDAGLPPPPPDAAPAPDARPKPAAPATVSLDMDAWCDVTIDGDAHGRARRGQRIELAPGRHQIVCSQGPGLAQWRTTVVLEPGEHRTLEGTLLRPVSVRIDLSTGTSARIGSRTLDDGATTSLQPGRYRVDILDRSGNALTGAWITIPTISSCTLKDHPTLDCYR
jgi:eukaryotic-like serine/threonine-protein kinase